VDLRHLREFGFRQLGVREHGRTGAFVGCSRFGFGGGFGFDGGSDQESGGPGRS
jgi:hypothetical protein